ncbi:hypothetical protein CDAR_390531 [Caerostris darwini]|uniref:Uncharacterized protein n=1 Tax=Caerostris darwini TaxID=1538125 RepID=A0AAV4T8S0_9ARAC|nr:hypothetical protein CDAR_390531 [Caerostris darwini]
MGKYMPWKVSLKIHFPAEGNENSQLTYHPSSASIPVSVVAAIHRNLTSHFQEKSHKISLRNISRMRRREVESHVFLDNENFPEACNSIHEKVTFKYSRFNASGKYLWKKNFGHAANQICNCLCSTTFLKAKMDTRRKKFVHILLIGLNSKIKW